MSAQQELAALLRDAKPGERYSRPTRGAGPTSTRRGGRAQDSARWADLLPELMHVEGALGSASVLFAMPKPRHPLGTVSERIDEPMRSVECQRCGALRAQELIDRETMQTDPDTGRHYGGGETWIIHACSCAYNQGTDK